MFIKEFDSVAALASYADATPSIMPTSARSSRGEGRSSFSGVASWAEALQLARSGWPDGCAEIEALTAQIFAAVADRVLRSEVITDVCGEMIDMGSYCEGRPDCWLATHHSDELACGTQTVTIVADVCASAGIGKDVIFTRGAALTALVAALELAGRPCEVIVTANTKLAAEVRVLVKRAGEPLQLDALAFALAHPAMLRRMMFAVWETAPRSVLRECGIYPNKGYGAVCETTGARGDVYLPPARFREPQWSSIESAKAWVLERLREHGVAVEHSTPA
jgi:hypothetical protein